MKNFRFGLPVIAILVAVMAASFTTKSNSVSTGKKLNMRYFYFQPGSGNENTLSNWTDDGASAPAHSCSGVSELCTIQAPTKVSGGVNVIDGSKLTSPFNLRTDANVQNQQYRD